MYSKRLYQNTYEATAGVPVAAQRSMPCLKKLSAITPKASARRTATGTLGTDVSAETSWLPNSTDSGSAASSVLMSSTPSSSVQRLIEEHQRKTGPPSGTDLFFRRLGNHSPTSTRRSSQQHAVDSGLGASEPVRNLSTGRTLRTRTTLRQAFPMLFHVTSSLEYNVRFPSTLMLNIHAQRSASQSVVSERFTVDPPVPFEEFIAQGSDNRFIRLKTGKAKRLTISYQASVECQFHLLPVKTINVVPVAELDRDALPYLFPSRYCQSDKLGRLAWDLFGKLPHPYEKVLAIVKWIHENVEYVRGSTSSDTSAYDTVTQRTGVCRDFAHLGIALCRALNIPARYFAGYAYELKPADFHACFECHIGGSWLVFDATHLAHLNGLIRIGTGRDAADASVASIFGAVQGANMQVDCRLAPKQQFVPFSRNRAKNTAVSLEASGAQ